MTTVGAELPEPAFPAAVLLMQLPRGRGCQDPHPEKEEEGPSFLPSSSPTSTSQWPKLTESQPQRSLGNVVCKAPEEEGIGEGLGSTENRSHPEQHLIHRKTEASPRPDADAPSF